MKTFKKKITYFLLLPLSLWLFSSCNSGKELVTFNYKTPDAEKGYISGSLIQTIPFFHETREVTAIPKEHYEFDHWSDGLQTASRSDKQLDTYVTDYEYEAYFKPMKYNVSFSISDPTFGTIAGESFQTIEYGKNTTAVELLLNEPNDYNFFGWQINGDTENLKKDNPLIIKNVDQELDIVALVSVKIYAKYALYIPPGGETLPQYVTFYDSARKPLEKFYEIVEYNSKVSQSVEIYLADSATATYSFDGWYINDVISVDGAKKVTNALSTVTPEDIGPLTESVYIFPYFFKK